MLGLLIAGLTACSSPETTVYATRGDGRGAPAAISLDHRSPDPDTWGPGPHPVVIFIHGGGWESGTRSGWGLTGRLKEAARSGFVAVSVDYRLTHDQPDGRIRWPWPAQLADVRCAVRWVRSNATALHADETRIAAVGYSAGGHLALMLGLAPEHPAPDPQCPWQGTHTVSHVISRAGPTDFPRLWDATLDRGRTMVSRLFGSLEVVRPDDARLLDASPLHWLDGDEPLHILQVQGGRDRLMPATNNARLHEALIAAGMPATYELFEDSGHRFPWEPAPGPMRSSCDG